MKQDLYIQHKLNLCTLNLFNKYVFKSLIGFLLSLFGSLAYIFLYYAVSVSKNEPQYFIAAFGGIIAISILPLSLLTIPAMNIEFRKSIFLRKLKTEQMSKYRYNSLLFSYFFCIETLVCLFNSAIYFLTAYLSKPFDIEGIQITIMDFIKQINVGSIFYAFFLLIIISISLGIFLSTVSNSTLITQLISIGIIFITILFGGQIITMTEWKYMDFMKYISLLSPISYPINAINISVAFTWNPQVGIVCNQLFDFNTNSYLEGKILFYAWFKPFFVFMPFLYSSLFFTLASLNFKYTSR